MIYNKGKMVVFNPFVYLTKKSFIIITLFLFILLMSCFVAAEENSEKNSLDDKLTESENEKSNAKSSISNNSKLKMKKGKSLKISKKEKSFDDYQDVFECVKDLSKQFIKKIKLIEGKFKRVVVFPLNVTEDKKEKLEQPSLALTELILIALQNEKDIVVLERERMNAMLEETMLAQLGVIDEKTAPKVGTYLGARALITGSMNQAGKKYVLTLRMIDAETTKILVSVSTTFPADSLNKSIDSIVEYKKKTDAILRSAAFPGLGQLYMQQPQRGYIYAGLSGISIVSAIFFALQAEGYYDKYSKEEPETVKYYTDYKNSANNYYLSLSVLATVYLANLVDIFFTAEDKIVYYPVSFEISPAKSSSSTPSFMLSYNW